MRTAPMFRISPSVAEEYRKLIHNPDARREWSIIPLSTIVWESRISIIRLVGARTALWLSGQVPGELQQLWEEAMAALPGWPGFRRLSLTDEDRAAVRLVALIFALGIHGTWVHHKDKRALDASDNPPPAI